jgi:hypothetical protein
MEYTKRQNQTLRNEKYILDKKVYWIDLMADYTLSLNDIKGQQLKAI